MRKRDVNSNHPSHNVRALIFSEHFNLFRHVSFFPPSFAALPLFLVLTSAMLQTDFTVLHLILSHKSQVVLLL